ncbi:MAG: N(omega),N(omega)-dimethylarginine dimethylaminohydrolase [Rhodanobacteraceae bacterium]|nr:MAG: N(omega),N(omega)-dimethylarginine dimethylaminohydrolase [Rhodanobacteraceae bacterium]
MNAEAREGGRRRIAITRAVSRALDRCELSHLPRRPIDIDLARTQHARYEQALRDAGCAVRQLPEQPDLPDSVFVEDTAIVLDEVAVVTRPSAASRRGEVGSVAAALSEWRPLVRIETPATLDGGDVLRLGRRLYVGASARSNADGIAQLAEKVAPFGYQVEAVPVQGCLHLKSAVTQVADDLLLVNPEWVDPACFLGCRWIGVARGEPFAANVLRIDAAVICAASQPATADALRRAGLDVRVVDMSETEKAEGGLTCCSLVFNA